MAAALQGVNGQRIECVSQTYSYRRVGNRAPSGWVTIGALPLCSCSCIVRWKSASGGYMREFTGQDRGPAASPLKPHHYPLWIIGFALVIVGACGYASLSLPAYFTTARMFAAAKHLDAAGRHAEAEPGLRAVLQRSPGSRKARLALAKALFSDDDPGNDVEALQLLAGLKLTKSEWDEISPFMPETYRRMFVQEKA